jgi:hypothetical protein
VSLRTAIAACPAGEFTRTTGEWLTDAPASHGVSH